MKNTTIVALIVFLTIIINTHNTIVTFYIEEEIQQPRDYVQISAIIKVGGDSLQEAIEQGENLIKTVKQRVGSYCLTYAKNKNECQDLVQASPYNINPQYQIYKKKTLFGGFVVAHQVLIKVKDAEGFGRLVDDLLKIGVSKIYSLTWKPLVEIDVEEIAVENGLQQAKKICEKIGMKLQKLVSVMEVSDLDDLHEQQEQQGQQGQQQQQQVQQEQQQQQVDIKDSITYYKFVIECSPTVKKIKKIAK